MSDRSISEDPGNPDIENAFDELEIFASMPAGKREIPLRHRTFNPELRSLVSRITGNESLVKKVGEESIDADCASSGPNRKNLIYLMHRLFYELKSLYLSESANRLYDPFYDDSEDPFNAIVLSYEDLFRGIEPRFLFFAVYSPDLRGFVSLNPVIGSFAAGSVAVGLYDRLHERLRGAHEGIIITSEEIDNNIYYQKIFGSADCTAVYIVDTAFILRPLAAEVGLEGATDNIYGMEPLLVMGLDNQTASVTELFRSLSCNRIPPALVASMNRMEFSGTAMDYDKLEVLHYLFMRNSDSLLLHLRIRDLSPDMMYLLRYLLNRIRTAILADYVPVAVNSREYILFTSTRHEKSIIRMIDQSTEEFGLPVDYEIVDRSLYPDFRRFFYEFSVKSHE